MKTNSKTIGLTCLGLATVASLISLLAAPALAQDSKPKADAGGAMGGMSQEAMQKMAAYATPGEPQKLLAQCVGTWKTTTKLWMGPGDPTTSTGSVTFEMIMGGRYLQGHHSGAFSGMPFEGLETDGYDNGKKQYFSLWIDNMGTGVSHLNGTASADGKGLTYKGKMYDPVSGKDMSIRQEIRWDDSNHFVVTMYRGMAVPGGKPQEVKMMEVSGEKS